MQEILFYCRYKFVSLQKSSIMELESLQQTMHTLVARTPDSFHRYMFGKLFLDEQMTGITGPRGVGKSTMLLQYAKSVKDKLKTLYVSADNLIFSTNSLVDLADSFVKSGGEVLLIDEVHNYAGWSRELKNIYDMLPGLKVVFTGSSVLDILEGQADLSRRAVMFHMQGLSFREYLELRHGITVEQASISELTGGRNFNELAALHPLEYFRDYLRTGYYPLPSTDTFKIKLQQTVARTVESDIPIYANMKASTARKIRQLLGTIASLAPFKPNLTSLSAELGVSRDNLPDYLTWLERAGMIMQLRDDTAGLRNLGKLEKVYLDNTNLAYAIGAAEVNIGNLRETFFLNQTRVTADVRASRISDFTIDGITFEIGGKKKGERQIRDAKKGFIVKDDIEYATGNVIPLWHFGLTY